MSFHDHKFWQEAYVAAIDVLEIFDSIPVSDVTMAIKQQSLGIVTTIADGLTRRDRREAEMKLRDGLGAVASLRSLLSVAWAQDVLTDEQFGKLDGAYESLSKLLK